MINHTHNTHEAKQLKAAGMQELCSAAEIKQRKAAQKAAERNDIKPTPLI